MLVCNICSIKHSSAIGECANFLLTSFCDCKFSWNAPARKAWGLESWSESAVANTTTEEIPKEDGSWKCRKGHYVWVRPGMTQCCHDRHTSATWCPWGPGCKLCLEKQEMSTATPTVHGRQSGWESSSDGWDEPPKSHTKSEVGAKLDYYCLPVGDLQMLFSKDDCPFHIVMEIERARKHPFFKQFMEWLFNEYDLPDDHVWGHDELTLDIVAFLHWLLETGRGFRDGDDPSNGHDSGLLDYYSLPPDLFDELCAEGCPYDVLKEIERARKHPFFKSFMAWLIEKHGLDDDYVWGLPEEEPDYDIVGFTDWLVETGRGFVYGDERAKETRMHSKASC